MKRIIAIAIAIAAAFAFAASASAEAGVPAPSTPVGAAPPPPGKLASKAATTKKKAAKARKGIKFPARPKVKPTPLCGGGGAILGDGINVCGDYFPQDQFLGCASYGSPWYYCAWLSYAPYHCAHYYFDFYRTGSMLASWRWLDNDCDGNYAWVAVSGI